MDRPGLLEKLPKLRRRICRLVLHWPGEEEARDAKEGAVEILSEAFHRNLEHMVQVSPSMGVFQHLQNIPTAPQLLNLQALLAREILQKLTVAAAEATQPKNVGPRFMITA